MSLILTILNKPNPGQEISSAFETGGTIGRAPDNTWVMVDPERFTSSKHAEIHCINGEYLLTDLSTNGVFINESPNMLGKGNQAKLKHGDKIRIGQYLISVTIQAGSALPLGDPDSSPFGQALNVGAPATADSLSPAMDLGRVDSPSPLDIGGHQSLDPLALFDNANPAQQGPQTDGNDFDDLGLGPIPSSPFDSPSAPSPFSSAGTLGDNSSPLQQQFEPAPTSPSADSSQSSVIPDNWHFGPAETAPPAQAKPAAQTLPPLDDILGTPAVAAEQAAPQNIIEPPQIPEPTLDDIFATPAAQTTPQNIEEAPQSPSLDELLAAPSPPAPSHNIDNASPITSSSVDDVFATPSPQPTPALNNAPAPMAPAPASPSNSADEIHNLLIGMGLEHINLTAEQKAKLALEAGQLIRASVDGLVTVLRARASIKSEFRMSMTTIQAKENNPLKFSPTGRDALNHMFTPGSSSYMSSMQAVQEGFADMEAHMIAVMAGMQTALHTVLKQFDPEMLERDFEQREKKSFSLGSKKAKHWDVYNKHYKEIIASVEDDFQTLFGDEFSRAYEEQIRKLKG